MSQQIIHHRIATTAKALAAAAYEKLAHDNAFHRLNRSLDRYVRRNWRHYIVFARQALVGILTKDFSHEVALGVYTAAGVEQMKNEVYECLVLDGQFKAPAEQRGPSLIH
jgi:hypothetical protein